MVLLAAYKLLFSYPCPILRPAFYLVRDFFVKLEMVVPFDEALLFVLAVAKLKDPFEVVAIFKLLAL